MNKLERLEVLGEQLYEKTARKMRIAVRIADEMGRKGIGKKELADKMNKRPSEITKWLSGTHNFTLDTISEISMALGSDLLGHQTTKRTRSATIGGNISWGRILLDKKE